MLPVAGRNLLIVRWCRGATAEPFSLMSLDDELDRLYQLPPSEFTAGRNALAKRAGARADEIRALPKPTQAVWAVNQLHWREPKLYRALIESAENLRATHKAVLAGKRGDLRAAGRAHEDALDAALKATLAIASDDGKPASDAVRQAIGVTLRSLPAADPPGRLRQALAPGGFEMLSGLPAGGRVVPASARPAPKRGSSAAPSKTASKAEERELEQARKALAAAAQALSGAEQAARREEFEAARAAREADKAERRVERAQEALEAARAELEEAEREAAAAARKREVARSRAVDADRELSEARDRHEAAREELARLR
jgi:DNA repair exonuclease SbcCD ATPase subunit